MLLASSDFDVTVLLSLQISASISPETIIFAKIMKKTPQAVMRVYLNPCGQLLRTCEDRMEGITTYPCHWKPFGIRFSED